MTEGMPLYFFGTVSYLIAILSILRLLFSLLQDYLWTNPHLFSPVSLHLLQLATDAQVIWCCCVCVFLSAPRCSGFPRSGCLFHWALQLNGCIEYGFIYFDNDKFSSFFFISFGFQFFLISSGNLFHLILKPVGSSLLLEGLICSQLICYDILTMLSLVAEDANARIVQIFFLLFCILILFSNV